MTTSIQRPAPFVVPERAITSNWTEPKILFAVEMWRAKASAADVADAINDRFDADISRNAIISKMHRLGLSHKGPDLPQELPSNTKGKPRAHATPKAKPAPKPKVPPKPKPVPRPVVVAKPVPAPRPAVPMALPESRRVAIQDLRIGHCRYIAGDPRIDATACGHPALLGSSWCEAHRILCTAVSRPRAVGSGSGFKLYARAA